MGESKVPRGRLAALLAPGALAWACIACVFAAHFLRWGGLHRFIGGIWVFELGVMLAGIVVGIAAFRLPSRALRMGVALWSFSAAAVLYEVLTIVMFCPWD